jgi:hypothetical protein
MTDSGSLYLPPEPRVLSEGERRELHCKLVVFGLLLIALTVAAAGFLALQFYVEFTITFAVLVLLFLAGTAFIEATTLDDPAPPRRSQPKEKPRTDPVIAELDGLFNDWRRRIEHADTLKKKLLEEYGDKPPAHIEDLLEDLDETLARHRIRESGKH